MKVSTVISIQERRNKCQRTPKEQSRIDNQDKRATQDTGRKLTNQTYNREN